MAKGKMGFGEQSKKGLKAPEDKVLYSHVFYGLIPGDVAVAIESVLKKGIDKYEETTTLNLSMSGDIVESPFVRYSTEDGIEIPFGTFRVDGIGDITMLYGDGGRSSSALAINGLLHNKECADAWRKFIQQVTETAQKDSIFKGKAFQVEGSKDLLVPKPLYLDKDIQVIFNDDVQKALDTCVTWPLRNRRKAKSRGIRVRRGALLDGFYGCGKSLFLYNAARTAHKAGWTVVNLSPGMIHAASILSPILGDCVLIVEDVDAGAHGDRDRLNMTLNSLSSVSTKCAGDFMLLVSTNFLSRIDPALLRPERIDALVKISLPDHSTIERLVRHFAGTKLAKKTNIEAACTAMEGCTPAIIGEVVQRSMIESEMLGLKHITEDLLLFHTKSMDEQKKFAIPEFRSDSNGESLARSLYHVTRGQL